jgi:EpsI family protein
MSDAKRYIPFGILLLGCLGLVKSSRQVSAPLARPLTEILPLVDGFETRLQVATKEEQAVAGMTDYVARTYWRDSSLAFTTLVSYYDRQTQGKSIHSPRNCLPGAGWEVMTVGSRQIEVNGTPHVVNRYTLKNGVLTAVVWYWYQGRGRVVANEYAVKWNLLRDAAMMGRSEEALVRIVVPVSRATGDSAQAAAVAKADSLAASLAARLITDVDRALPKRSAEIATGVAAETRLRVALGR